MPRSPSEAAVNIDRLNYENIDLMPRSPSVPTAAYGGLIYGKGRSNYAREEGYNLCEN